MKRIAFLFSGQGAQYPGMGKELFEDSPAARAVFDLADEIRPGTSEQCFFGTKEELVLTANTQPCLFCMDLAAACALAEKGIAPAACAGFSLGEIAALSFTGVLSYEDGFRLVCKRAALMQEAAEKAKGAMAAVLKLSDAAIEALCDSFPGVYPVNYNCPGQVAVAGRAEAMPAFCAAVKEAGGKAVMLAVSGAFHSPLMDEAAAGLGAALEGFQPSAPRIPLYANRTGELYGENIRELIATQVNHPVRWTHTVQNMAKAGAEVFVECGAGKTLAGLVSKILPDAVVCRVENAETLKQAVRICGG